jgi:hypothetical protein
MAIDRSPIIDLPGVARIEWVSAEGAHNWMDLTEQEALLLQRILNACELEEDDGLSVQRLEAVTIEVERERGRYLAELSGQGVVPSPSPSPGPVRTPNPLPPVEDVGEL